MPIECEVCVTVNIETLGDTFPSLRNPMQLWLLRREEFSMRFIVERHHRFYGEPEDNIKIIPRVCCTFTVCNLIVA